MPQSSVIVTRTAQDSEEIGRSFLFEVRGGLIGGFSRIRGLREEIEVLKWRDPVSPLEVRNGIGTVGGGVVTLEKGVLRDASLIRWFGLVRDCSRRVVEGKVPLFNSANISNASADLQGFIDQGKLDRMFSEPAQTLFSEFQALNTAQELGSLGVFRSIEVVIGDCSSIGGAGAPRGLGIYNTIRHIVFDDCFPAAYEIGDLDAGASGLAIESLSLAFNSMRTDIGTGGGSNQGQGGSRTDQPQDFGRVGDGPALVGNLE